MQPLAGPNEQLDAQVLLELANPGRDIGLHAMQPLGRAGYAALTRNRAENFEIREIHISLYENEMIQIIHFM
jgi:hypothetical protein